MTHPRLLRYARQTRVALDANTAHKTAASHALVHYASGSIYSFIPKNACSTLRLSLALANGAIATPKEFAWIHPNNHTFRADLRDLVTAPYTFVILRCPYRRLASAFLDKIVSRTAEFWALYRALGDQPDPDLITFRTFVEAITPKGRLNSNVHWRPQKDFLVYERYDDTFQMERFGAVASQLKARAGLELADARGFTRHGTDGLQKVGGEAFADLPARALLEMRRQCTVPDYDALYDDALAEHVTALYRKDVNFYRAYFGADDLLFDVDPQKATLSLGKGGAPEPNA